MRITVRLHGVLARHMPGPRLPSAAGTPLELEVPAGIRAGEVGERLGLPPGLIALVAVNGRRAAPEQPLQDGDHLTLFPPVAGGEDSASREQA